MSTITRVKRFTEGVVVLCDNEADADQYFWLVPMTGWELEAWWETQQNFEQDPNGDVRRLYQVLGEIPPEEHKLGFPGEFLPAEEFDELKLWDDLAEDGCHYRCQLCCNTDSYLKRPDGGLIRHAGYVAPQEGPP